jgi:protein ImuB
VLGGEPWDPGAVLDCSPSAQRLGVRRGQPLGEAHKLASEALFLRADRPAYRAALEEALEALSALTPALEGEDDPDAETFGEILLGVEGLERLWGDERTLLDRACATVASILPGAPRAAFGNTRFGARVAALQDRSIPPGDAATEAAYLAPLPIRLLTGDDELQARFRLFGLTRIGDFAALERSAILARFGRVGGDAHDLANGRDGRPLVPRTPIERLRADAELDPPVDTTEPLRFVLRHLAGALCEQLAARGAGAARAIVVLELERRESLRIEQQFPEPVAIPELLERLLVARLETSPPSGPVTRLSLDLDGTAPASGQQLGLFTPQSAQAARLEWQLASLAIRFGPRRLYRARLRDPEARLAHDRFELLPQGVAS